MNLNAIHSFVRRGVAWAVTALALLATAMPAMSADTFTVDFPATTPATYLIGSGKAVALKTAGTMPTDGRVIVSAWDVKAKKLVTAFTTVLRGEPWQIPAAAMNKLPANDVVITIESLKPARKVSRRFTILAPKTTATTSPITATTQSTLGFNIAFADGTSSSYTLNSGVAVQLTPQGTLPVGKPVVISAWDKKRGQLVASFTTALTAAPWTIPASQMNKLPVSDVVITLEPVGGTKVSKVFTILAEPPFKVEFAAGTSTTYELGSNVSLQLTPSGTKWENQPVVVSAWNKSTSRLVTDFTMTLRSAPWTIPASQMNKLPLGEIVITLEPLGGPKVSKLFTVVKPAPVPFQIGFAPGTGSTYQLGSTASVALEATGSLPTGKAVIISAWDKSRGQVVSGFTLALSSEPWVISAARMNMLPAGDVIITLEPLGGQKVSRAMTILPIPQDNSNNDNTSDNNTDENNTVGDNTDNNNTDGNNTGGDNTVGDNTDGGNTGGDSTDGSTDPVVPQPIPFTISFASVTPATYTIGSGVTVKFDVAGDLPPDGHVVVSAWDVQHQSVVSAFTFAMTGEPFRIPPAQMDKLAAGDMVLTVEPVGFGAKVSRRITVLADPNNPEPEPEPVPEPDTPAQDWTTFNKESDTRVIYVSTAGDDNKDGLSPTTAVKSISKGVSLLRHGYPDWLMLRAGDRFSGGLGTWTRSGRSATAKMLIGSYGSGARPVLDSGNSNGIDFSGTVKNVAIVGLHFYSGKRDPGSSQFDGGASRPNGVGAVASAVDGLHIEDCLIEYFAHGVMLEMSNDSNVRIHRCVIRRNYSHTSKGHSQGVYGLRVSNLMITDSVLDTNGWEPRVSAAGRTIFNHNIYIIGCKNVLIEGNIFSRGSSYGLNLRTGSESGQDMQNVTIRNNLIIDNANTIAAGGKVSSVVSTNLVITDNVFTRHGAVISSISQSLGINGFCLNGIDVSRNLFIDKTFGGTSFAVKFEPGAGPVSNGKVNGNVIHGWKYSETPIQPKGSNMSASGNLVDQPASIYVDASRTIDKYLASIGSSSSVSSLLDRACQQSKANWQDAYSARTINTYFRRGFELRPFD